MPARFLRSSSVCARRCTPSPAVSGGRCACSPTPRRCRPFCRGKLAAWMAAHPGGADRNRRTHQARDIVSCILAGVAQAGVVSDAVDPGPLRALDPVADDPLALIEPPARPLAEKQEVAFAAVLNEPLVALHQTSALQQHIEQHAAELGQALKRSGQDEPFCRGFARRWRTAPAGRSRRALLPSVTGSAIRLPSSGYRTAGRSAVCACAIRMTPACRQRCAAHLNGLVSLENISDSVSLFMPVIATDIRARDAIVEVRFY